MIVLSSVYKSYLIPGQKAHPVLSDISLTINAGEYIAIMGSSGSGKSTLMNILGCLDKPIKGSYCFDGKRIDELDRVQLAKLRNEKIGFVFQGFNLLARRTVLDNVCLPMIYTHISKSERQRRAMQILERVGLAEYAQRLPTQLSGGQQQRVAIARALVNQPQLVLADEPTGNLDSQTSTAIMQLFTDLNADLGITIVLVTHEPDIADYTKRLIRIKDGQIADDTVS